VVKWVANCKVKRQRLKLLFSAISASNFDSLSHPHFSIFSSIHFYNKKTVITILCTVIKQKKKYFLRNLTTKNNDILFIFVIYCGNNTIFIIYFSFNRYISLFLF